MCDHLLVSDHLSKTTIFSLSNLVSNCNQFLGWQFNNVSLFLSLCKWPLNAWFVPYVRWVCYTTFINRVRKESLVSTWNYTCRNLEIACNESLSKCRCFQTFSRKRLLWINSRNRPPSLKQPLNLRILGSHFWEASTVIVYQ